MLGTNFPTSSPTEKGCGRKFRKFERKEMFPKVEIFNSL
jgi:hypothetical protein